MLSISWLRLAKCCLITVLCYFTDCSIRVSDCSIRVSLYGCCNAPKNPCIQLFYTFYTFFMYSAVLHVFSCHNLKLDAKSSLVKISKIVPIMLALCLMLLVAYYANYYADIISQGLLCILVLACLPPFLLLVSSTCSQKIMWNALFSMLFDWPSYHTLSSAIILKYPMLQKIIQVCVNIECHQLRGVTGLLYAWKSLSSINAAHC